MYTWSTLSLSIIQYKELTQLINQFVADEIKLRQLQETGHLPMIVSQRNALHYEVTLAPDTLKVLSDIDDRFWNYTKEAKNAAVDLDVIDVQKVLLGHRESFRKYALGDCQSPSMN